MVVEKILPQILNGIALVDHPNEDRYVRMIRQKKSSVRLAQAIQTNTDIRTVTPVDN